LYQRAAPTKSRRWRDGVDQLYSSSHNDQYDHIAKGVAVITETSAVSFRQNLGEMLNQVQYRHDSVVINKDGKPVAALVDARLFERIRRMQGRFDALCQRIEAGFAQLPEAEGLAEIEAAIASERAQVRALAGKA
jgi:prevent-host-death family protein